MGTRIKKSRVYFKGYFGYKNIGDDLFCVIADWICNNIWKNKKPLFIGRNLPVISKNSKKVEIRNPILSKIVEFIICLFIKDIIFFGGSLFSKRPIRYKSLNYYFNKLKIFHSKLMTIGTSIGPFGDSNDYQFYKNFLSKFKWLGVRDYYSYSLVENWSLQHKSSFTFDVAILVTEVFSSLIKDKQKKMSEKFKLAVSLCHYERYVGGDLSQEKERENSVLYFINSIIESNQNLEEIVFFVFNGNEMNGDLDITKEFNENIKNKVKTRIVNYTSDTEAFCKELAKCDFLIGLRLHAGILAYALKIPFLLIEYHNKSTEFLNTVNHLFRFDIKNNHENLKNFNVLLNNQSVPDLKDPSFFKERILESLKKLNTLC